MNKRFTSLGLWTIVLGAGMAASLALSQPPAKEKAEEGDEATIKLSEAPEAVRTAALKLTAEKNITKVIRESDEGITTFEVEFTDAGASGSGTFTPAGDTLEVERGVTEAKLPAATLAAIKKANPGATFSTMVHVTKFYYEIEVVKDGKKHGVKVNAAGEIEEAEHAKEADEEHEKKGK